MLRSIECKGTFSRAVYAFWEAIDSSPFGSQPGYFDHERSKLLAALRNLGPSKNRRRFRQSIQYCITVKTEDTLAAHQERGPSLVDFFRFAIKCIDPEKNSIDFQEIRLPVDEIENASKPQ